MKFFKLKELSTLNNSNLFQKRNFSDLALLILFSIYLILGLRIPVPVANIIDSIPGKITIGFAVIALFICAHPVVAILSLFVAFDLLRRASLASGKSAIANYSPSEINKAAQLTAFNQFPYTLEQQMVKEMAPIPQSGNALSNATYKPMLEKQHHAASILRT